MKTKTCSKCKEPKALKEFYFRNKAKGTRQHHCIPCLKGYKDNHYQKNKESYKSRCGERRNRMILEARQNICSYLSTHPCVDCGNNNMIVLEFDHEDPSTKVIEISVMIRRGSSWIAILSEIEKCKVRCANCHRIRTAGQSNSYKLRWCAQQDSNLQPSVS